MLEIITFSQLEKKIKKYLHRTESLQLIEKAYQFASKAHEGQLRKSGEPYITHPLQVANLLVELETGPVLIASALLHDVIEDCNIGKEELLAQFGEEITTIVDSLTKIGKLKDHASLKDFQAENHRKIFIAMAKDIRVILIKLADRYCNMKTLEFLAKEKQRKIARETLDVYAPIAHRLGLSEIKIVLEDTSLLYLEPERYQEIEQLLLADKVDREKEVELMKEKIQKMLAQENLPIRIFGRQKSIYSIYKKIYFKGHNYSEIYDIMALRVITESEVNCYEVLGYIHATYRPIPGRFKDYIAMPKPNLYQSLHTCIVSDTGNIFEIQIRTERMDQIAEKGVAAHWRYKEQINYDNRREQKEIEEKLHWFRDFVIYNDENDQNNDSNEVVDVLKKDIFEANVYVLTPKGLVIDLPNGSTPIDFAYKVHTQVGHNAIGATANGHLVPLNYILKTGDVISIKTTKTNGYPSEGWLKFAKTANARNSIKKALIKKDIDLQKDVLLERGQQALVDYAKERGIPNILESINQKILESINYHSLDDLFVALATGALTPQQAVDKMSLQVPKEQQFDFKKRAVKQDNSYKDVKVKGTDSLLTTFANCCNPIPGDDIVGYISRGQGMKIHRKSCSNVKELHGRLVDVSWNEALIDSSRNYLVHIEIRATDRSQLLVDILNRLAQAKVQVVNVNAKVLNTTMIAIFNISIMVNNKKELLDIFTILEGVKGVIDVKRVNLK